MGHGPSQVRRHDRGRDADVQGLAPPGERVTEGLGAELGGQAGGPGQQADGVLDHQLTQAFADRGSDGAGGAGRGRWGVVGGG